MKKGFVLSVEAKGLKPFLMKIPCLITVEIAVGISALELER